MHQPNFDDFRSLAQRHDFVPVYRRVLSDTLTPVTAFKLLDDGGPACLFESVVGGEKVGRYSFLATQSMRRFTATGNQVLVIADDQTVQSFQSDDPLDSFRKYFQFTVADPEGLPPFIGGAIGYAGYDVVRYAEKLPNAPQDDRQLPDFDFEFYHTLCVFDHVDKTILVVHLVDCRDVKDDGDSVGGNDVFQQAYDEGKRQVDDVVGRLSQPHSFPVQSVAVVDDTQPHLEVRSNFTKEEFCQGVRKCVEYIRAGDIFQVVPSQRLSVKSDIDPLEIYRSLRVVNPSPFMFFVRSRQCTLVGCSPEIMCRVDHRRLTVRPLAGTRRRGKNDAEDKALERELLADPKERAEHVMLVDLGRNDVGRVAKFGTVDLTEVMVIERYSHVMHISSEVQGQLRDDVDAFDALKACLPAGTVSGAPKVRAMQIIDEIEPHRRGPYGGAVGYIDYRGNMDTCLALRTMVVQDGTIYVQAGCGVVADSDPDAEYEETLNKAKAMIAGIEMAVRRCRP
ncbi:anthranilate synthase component I [Crateriforma conspicua]|uniref:Anthranilate synthase component 1 n=1 Tax=Crateriforma conspicua TaxID=2527996 RepID=A0A5C5Y641_9PLAN|nr:anthranilate synthase component I [Crateriforma conspicua]QDV65295.1 Anthranilate synthase component 1 [Crateriforma conspicua]TWT70690.1 Anthranilate synthase component 1 [Crateriforma conspicua]